MTYETVWAVINTEDLGSGSEQMDGVFVPIPEHQKAILEKALRREVEENRDRFDEGYTEEYYLERMEATHWLIHVSVPSMEDDEPIMIVEQDECTWWDFGVILAKQVDGEWYVWGEDPGDIGNIWYQSTYTKREAYAVRDLAIEVANAGELYNESVRYDERVGDEYYYETQAFYELVKQRVMTWW